MAVVELDFETKKERPIALEDARASMEAGRFVWIDVDAADLAEARGILGGLGVLGTDEVDLLEPVLTVRASSGPAPV